MALHTNYEIRWQNYRAFRDTGWVRIRPLTILIGPNNAGKTSVVSPLLLMAQTTLSRDAMTPLVTRGPLMDAGTFRDILHDRDISRNLSLGFRFHNHDPMPGGRIRKIGDYPPGAIEVTFEAGERPEDIQLKQFELSDVYNRLYVRQTRNPKGTYRLSSYHRRAELRKNERRAINQSKPTNFLFTTAPVLNAVRVGSRSVDETPKFSPSNAFSEYLGVLAFAWEELRSIFYRLNYVGPLRDPIQRYYQVAGEMSASVGSKGEHMANVLRRRDGEIRKNLNSWIRRFEFGDRLYVDDLSEQLFSLSLQDSIKSRRRINVADVGFGASQVLPLIVQALTAPEGSLTIAEQPEIHLNPRLQGVLAELFVEMATSDHRVIVETHSEHLLLRLRTLIANRRIAAKDVAVYFVEKADGYSHIRHIDLDDEGNFLAEQWPHGFFEDTLQEALVLAQAQSDRHSEQRSEDAR